MSSTVTFGQPLWFWALALLAVLIALFVRAEARRGKLLRQLVAARLQDRLAGNVSLAKRRARFTLLLLGLASVIVSLAQPRLGFTWEDSKRTGRDVLLAIDCSRSMLATDLAPSRLARAKLAAQDILGQLQGDRVGLIAFAGTAFLQAPLTVDYGAVLDSMAELDTEVIPLGGTNLAAAIKTAVEAFGKGEGENRCLIIFTDGEELDADGIKAAEAQKGSVRIFTVGLGSSEGSLIPVLGPGGGTEFVKDERGQIVKSRLDEERLKKVAEATGGFYVHLESGPVEMQQLYRDGLAAMKERDIDVKMSRRPIERYQWPLSAALGLIAAAMLLGERRRGAVRRAGNAAAAGVTLMLILPPSAGAKNGGVEAYERQDYQGALQEFSRQLQRRPDSEALHFDAGAAAYKAGDYGRALEAFAKAVTAREPGLRAQSEYNLGNTLYQRGAAVKEKEPKIKEWRNALQHYDQALLGNPKNGDAKFNRDLVQKLIEDLEKEPPKQDEPPKKDQEKDKKEQEKKDEKEDQKKGGKDEKKDSAKDEKGEQPKDEPGKNGAPKDQPSQDGKDGKGDQEKPENASGSHDEKKETPPQEAPGGNPNQANDSPPGQPSPLAPQNPEKKPEGEIQAAGEQPPKTADERESEEVRAGEAGKMTETQARELLDSLKGESDHVKLLKPDEHKGAGRVLKDW